MTKKIALLVSLGLLSLSAFAQAEDDFGNFSNDATSDVAVDSSATASVEELGLFGGNIWDAAVDASTGRVYAVAKDSPNGFYWSDDGGANWNGLAAGVDYGGSVAVEVNQTDGTVFTTFGSLYRSTDHGVTFTNILSDGSEALLYAQDHLIMGSNNTMGSIQLSSDNGDTFSEVVVDPSVTIWWIADGVAADTFYVVGYDDAGLLHIYQSTTAGASWTEMTIPSITDSNAGGRFCVNSTDATNMFIAGGYSASAYYSTDSGSTWTELPSVNSQTCVSDATGRVYIGGNYTDDKGVTWGALADDNDLTETAVGGHGLTVDPNDENIIYADGMPGLSKSTDRGASWEDVNNGLRGVVISDISQADDKDIVWAAAYNGVAKTTNFTSDSPTWDFPVLQEPADSVWVMPENSDVVVVGEIGAIQRTTDGGTTWTDVTPTDITHDYVVSQIIEDRTDSLRIYAAVAYNQPGGTEVGMVYQSDDAGATWTDLAIADNASAQTITQDLAGDLFVGAGSDLGNDDVTGVYKYDGSAWTHLSGSPATGIVKIIADPNDATRIYAVGSHAYGNGDTTNFGFYVSADSGDTWTKITDGLDSFRELTSLTLQASTTPSTLYLGVVAYSGQAELYKSSDAGDSWGLVYTGLKDETFNTMIFDGVTVGSSRGLFTMTSKATVRLRSNHNRVAIGKKATLTVTLKDAATSKKLRNKTVKILKKKSGSYVVWKTVETNSHGTVTLKLPIKAAKRYKLKARWTPNNADNNEYTRVTSSILTVRGH